MNRMDHSEIFAPLLGMSPWNVALGVGSFLTMEFGKPEIISYRSRKVIHGQWHLWLQDCEWQIDAEGKIFAASGHEHNDVRKKIHLLEFGLLNEARVNDRLDLNLIFERGFRLSTSTVDSENPQWELFKPDGMVLVAGAKGVLTETPSGGLQSLND